MTEEIGREINKLPYKVLVNSKTQRMAAEWCLEKFGERWDFLSNRNGRWTALWAGLSNEYGKSSKYKFLFANEQDLMLFMLRWS